MYFWVAVAVWSLKARTEVRTRKPVCRRRKQRGQARRSGARRGVPRKREKAQNETCVRQNHRSPTLRALDTVEDTPK